MIHLFVTLRILECWLVVRMVFLALAVLRSVLGADETLVDLVLFPPDVVLVLCLAVSALAYGAARTERDLTLYANLGVGGRHLVGLSILTVLSLEFLLFALLR